MEKENDDGKELAELSLVGEIRAMSWSASLSTLKPGWPPGRI